MNTLEHRAADFARSVHASQVRKYTGEPYITHCAAVADLVRAAPHTEEMLAAAWLHDVVEDCGVQRLAILNLFGGSVFILVDALTDVSLPSDGNRARRKAIDREHLRYAPPEAKTVKLADLIDNTVSIVAHDPKFAKVYLAEKRALLEVLMEGDPDLWRRAAELVKLP